MASSGKKNRKNKGTAISLQSFLSNGENPQHGLTQVAKKVRGSDCEDSDDGSQSLPQIYQLPTAPRASREFDDSSISHSPPFLAYATNLPFDIHDDDIHNVFSGLRILSIRLPRDDGETGRVKGFGYIEFETRDDLVKAISMPEQQIKGRRIKMSIANDADQGMRGKNRRRYDGFGSSDEYRDNTNWRSNNDQQNDDGGQNRNFRYNRDRPQNDDNQGGSWRTGGNNSSSHRSDSSGYSRNSDRNWGHARNSGDDDLGERPKLNLQPRTLPLPKLGSSDSSTVQQQQQQTDEQGERPKLNIKPRTLPAPKTTEDTISAKDEDANERPKLNLQPRTLPLPKIVSESSKDEKNPWKTIEKISDESKTTGEENPLNQNITKETNKGNEQSDSK